MAKYVYYLRYPLVSAATKSSRRNLRDKCHFLIDVSSLLYWRREISFLNISGSLFEFRYFL